MAAEALDPLGAPADDLLQRVGAYRSCLTAAAGVLRALGDEEGAGAALTLPCGSGDGGADASAAAEIELRWAAGAAGGSGGGAAPAHAGPATPTHAELGDQSLGHHDPGAAGSEPQALAAAPGPPAPRVPPHCVPIHANVTTFDWPALAAAAQFDVVLMDPPWQARHRRRCRAFLGSGQLSDASVAALPVPALQRRGEGLLFVWVINAKYRFTLDLFDAWGYELIDEIVWVKTTVNRRLFKSHGYYLQHAKEVCLPSVPAAGAAPADAASGGGGVGGGDLQAAGFCDVIISERRGQSQKPEELYDLIEALVPGGRYLEVFARRNNLRDYWVSIGNEIGEGLPESDRRALAEGAAGVPGARYGRGGG
ncbi:MAG: MT-A70-domain-containing protein [Monoraphidium minutum]|nr:MAG: MT-A70-domain-containing protein [Monoraphidium minutum]